MSKYLYGVNHARQRRFLYRSRRVIYVIILMSVLILLAIFIDSYLQKRKAQTPSTPTHPISSTVEPSIQIFTTPYFQFQTNKKWNFIANESSTTKFLYRRGDRNLVSGEMVVYVNSSPTDIQATHILPVTLKEDTKSLKASFVSDVCRKNLSKTIQQTQGEAPITLQSVRFLCDVDGTNFTIIVGQENGTPIMNFTRPDGSKAGYLIYIRDLRAVPEPSEFPEIMNSFQIR